MKRAETIGLGLALAALVAACGGSQDSPREVKFKRIGKVNKTIVEELKQPSPSIEAIKSETATLVGLADELPSWFPIGSGPESGIDTAARPAVWERPEEFRQAAARFRVATGSLDVAAAASDLGKIRAEVRALAKSCKSCHDKFRDKK